MGAEASVVLKDMEYQQRPGLPPKPLRPPPSVPQAPRPAIQRRPWSLATARHAAWQTLRFVVLCSCVMIAGVGTAGASCRYASVAAESCVQTHARENESGAHTQHRSPSRVVELTVERTCRAAFLVARIMGVTDERRWLREMQVATSCSAHGSPSPWLTPTDRLVIDECVPVLPASIALRDVTLPEIGMSLRELDGAMLRYLELPRSGGGGVAPNVVCALDVGIPLCYCKLRREASGTVLDAFNLALGGLERGTELHYQTSHFCRAECHPAFARSGDGSPAVLYTAGMLPTSSMRDAWAADLPPGVYVRRHRTTVVTYDTWDLRPRVVELLGNDSYAAQYAVDLQAGRVKCPGSRGGGADVGLLGLEALDLA